MLANHVNSAADPRQPRVGVGVIVMREGRVLLGLRTASHGNGTWALPGGHLEFGEDVESCARREVREETGLELAAVTSGPFVGDVFADEGKHYVTLFVIADCLPGEAEVREPDKCARWSWFPWSDLPEPLFQPLNTLRRTGFAPRTTLDDARAKAVATYNAAADAYDDPANVFWARFGHRTIERVGVRPGERVLDVCCGSGASAIPAAEAVGSSGCVIGIDLSTRLLELARAKATDRRLQNIEFRVGDMLHLRVPASHFDVVLCVFGIFFVPDMPAAVRALWRAVRPKGRLAITTWGPRFFEPANTGFWNAIREVRPDLYKSFNPWDRICDPSSVLALLREGGIDDAEAIAEAGEHPIPSPEAWWSAVLGSGYRGTLESLSVEHRERVHAANLAYVRCAKITSVEANVVYAVARKE